MIQLLNAIAATLPTTAGGETHGHMRLMMKPELYSTLSEIQHTVPVDLGPIPIYTPGSSGLPRQQITIEFDESKRILKIAIISI